MLRTLLALALAFFAVGAADAQDRLGGTYQGVKDAEGARIEIAPDAEGFTGTFFDPKGARQDFQADRVGESAEAVLDMAGGPALMQISPMPFGAEVILIPVAPDGTLQADRGRVDSYVRPGLSVPEPPQGFVPPPVTPQTRIAGNGFLASYEFWSPTGVRNGYLALPERVRTMMRFFPAVQLDVIFKLCLAPQAEAALAQALRGQGVDCREVVDTIAAAQRSGRFDAYKAEVAGERDAFRTTVRCGDGYVESKSDCDAAARQLAAAALDLRTAANVLARYR